MWTQLHPLYRALGGPGSQRARGRFFVELCETAACERPHRYPIGDADAGPFPSIDAPPGPAHEARGLPAGRWHLRLVLDTAYSRALGATVEAEDGAGDFDVRMSAAARRGRPCDKAARCDGGAIRDGKNPPPLTLPVTLSNNRPLDLGRVVFGHVVARVDTPNPAPAAGWLLVAATGTGARDAIHAIDGRTHAIEPPDHATLGGRPFRGDFCGFVRGEGDDLWVLGFGARDGHVFRYDTRRRAFVDQPAVTVTAPPGSDALVALCRGVFVRQGDRARLVLIEHEGAGARDSFRAYPLAIVDVTDPKAPRATPIGGREGLFAGHPPKVSPVLRGVATDGTHVFVLAPSWRTGSDGQSRLYTLALDPATGMPSLRHAIAAGEADDQCGSTLHFVPALAVAPMAGAPVVFVGTDAGLDLYDAAALAAGRPAKRASLDLADYGVLPTSLAVAAGRLYALPNCKSRRHARLAGRSINRHAVAIVDLESDARAPRLLETHRRFDDPGGGPTGGVDLGFTAIKRDVLRSYKDGVIPPVTYTGPQIAVGPTALYLRGAGISLEKNAPTALLAAGVSGLGQAGDIGVMDLATGEGTISRPDYTIWFDGPSAPWGLPLRPGAEASTAAIEWIADPGARP
ncbi:MAG: hypothetical protein H6701_06765 [Myxococcales bacterium]|nr:hypothetical protein [Myxococcales bacterium]